MPKVTWFDEPLTLVEILDWLKPLGLRDWLGGELPIAKIKEKFIERTRRVKRSEQEQLATQYPPYVFKNFRCLPEDYPVFALPNAKFRSWTTRHGQQPDKIYRGINELTDGTIDDVGKLQELIERKPKRYRERTKYQLQTYRDDRLARSFNQSNNFYHRSMPNRRLLVEQEVRSQLQDL